MICNLVPKTTLVLMTYDQCYYIVVYPTGKVTAQSVEHTFIEEECVGPIVHMKKEWWFKDQMAVITTNAASISQMNFLR